MPIVAVSRVVVIALTLVFGTGCVPSVATLSARPSDAEVPADEVARGDALLPFRAPDGAWGFMDADGTVAVPAQYDGASEFREGRAVVEVDGRYGFIDPRGRMVLEPLYEEVEAFSDGRARVALGQRDGRRFGFVGPDGRDVVAPTLRWATVFRNGLTVVQLRDEKLTLLQKIWVQIGGGSPSNHLVALDPDGRVVLDLPHDHVSTFSEGLAAFQPAGEDRWGYLALDGTVAIEPQFDGPALPFSEGLARVGQGGQIGYVDATGRFAIDPQFRAAGPFSEGLAPVRVGDRWGYVDATGAVVIEPRFEQASGFSEGLAPVRSGGAWGYIDTDGQTVIAPAYRAARPFRGGFAIVFLGGRPLAIDRAGTPVDPQH